MTSTTYVVEVETTATFPTKGLEAFLDTWTTTLEPWHPAISGTATHVVATITLPAETLTQAVAAAVAIVGQLAPALAVQAMPEQLRDARQGWAPVPDMMSVADAAAALGVSRQRVLQMIDEGKLPGTKVGRSYTVPRSAVEAIASA